MALTSDPQNGSTNITGYVTVSLDDYVADVLPNEWGPVGVFADYPECLKAGALAIKTFAWYRKLHPRDPNFDVYNSTADQVYLQNSRSTNAAYVNALNAVKTIGMCTTDGTIFKAQYWNGIVSLTSGGTNIRSAPSLSGTILSTPMPPQQLYVVDGGLVMADGYRWWKVTTKNSFPPPSTGVGFAAGANLLYPGGVSIDSQGNGNFIGQITQYGTRYWAYTGDTYQTILQRSYNASSPQTSNKSIRFFTYGSSPSIISASPTSTTVSGGSTLTINYTINAPVPQAVILGASVAPTGTTSYYSDTSHDLKVTLPAGRARLAANSPFLPVLPPAATTSSRRSGAMQTTAAPSTAATRSLAPRR